MSTTFVSDERRRLIRAHEWIRLFPNYRLCGQNELGVWWDDPAGSTHLERWPLVEARLAAESYVRSAAASTRFTETQISASLNDLLTKTGDQAAAIALNERAMDFAVLADISLHDASNTLGLAHAGNRAGVRQLATLLGVTPGDTQSGEKLLAQLDEMAKGIARTEDTFAGAFDKFGERVRELGREIQQAAKRDWRRLRGAA